MPDRRRIRASLLALSLAQLSQAALAAACGPYELHAHRGAPSEPENTTSSVKAAMSMSYDAVEVDVQKLQDGQWVLLHDAIIGRTVQAPRNAQMGLINQPNRLDSRQWSSLVVLDRQGRPTQEPAPFLRDVLAANQNAVDIDKKLHIEIKGNNTCNDLKVLGREMDNALGTGWKASSFNLKTLSCLRQQHPDVYLGVIVGPEKNGTPVQMDKVKEMARRLGGRAEQFVDDSAQAYDQSFNRQYLTSAQIKNLADEFSPMGLHMDATTLVALPRVTSEAKNAGAKVMTYSARGDEHHLQQLALAKKSGSGMPHGMIIDGKPEEFCRQLKNRGI